MENTWDKIFTQNITDNKTNNKDGYSPYLPMFNFIDGVALDIGTGFGEDAVYLSNRSRVYATDYSSVAIEYNKEKYPYINWLVHNTTEKFPYEDNKFDFINSYLSLHYFSYEQLDSIFAEIKRMGKKDAAFVYAIKLSEEKQCNTGKLFVSEDEHMFLIEKHFSDYRSHLNTEIYCGNSCKTLTFYISL